MKRIFGLCLVTMLISFVITDSFSQNIKGTFAIKNVKTGIFLRIKDANKTNKTPLVAYSPVNWKCATWDFNHIDGQNYQLKNLFTGKTFESDKHQLTEGALLQQQPFVSNKTDQQYEFIPVKKDIYLIRLRNTDLYVTPSDIDGTVNSPIILTKKNGTDLQQWTLHEQKPEI